MGITAIAADTQKVLAAITAIINLLKQLNPPRAVVADVLNLTNSPLRLVSHHHDDGGFAEPPSPEIGPGQIDVFGSKSSGVASGTKGEVTYESDEGFILRVKWGNPFVGGNDSEATVVGANAGAFETSDIAGAGDVAHMQYIVRPGIPHGILLRKGEGEAGRVSEIKPIRTGNRELLTAVRAGEGTSGTLRLINWFVKADGSLKQNGESGNQAGEASNIDIAQGRLFVTACRSGAQTLLLISWDIVDAGQDNEGSPLRRIRRVGDSRNQGGDQAGEASQIKIVALSETLFVTAVRTDAGSLTLITWRLEDNGELTRISDSADQAGAVSEISLVRISPVPSGDRPGDHRVVTSVRGGDGTLILITWRISTDGSTIERLSFDHGQAGEAKMIRSVVTTTDRLVTSMQDGSDDLLLITWNIAESGHITRLADSHGQAGEINSNALMSRPGGVLSAVNTPNGLKLITWQMTAQGGIKRVMDSGEQAGEAPIVTLCQAPLDGDAPIATAVRAQSGDLKVISWSDQ